MKIPEFITTAARHVASTAATIVTAAACITALAACDGTIYDDEGDCEVHYRVGFRYDMNMKFADAFPHEVTSVSVYAYDSGGKMVWHGSDKGAALAANGYSMPLDLPAGDYTLIAWCGTDNGTADESFTVAQTAQGDTMDKLTCSLNTTGDKAGGASNVSDKKLFSLYHGMAKVTVTDKDDPRAVPGTHVTEVPLTKDTNHVRVMLQQLSGEDVDTETFSFTIEDDNALMAHDNSLMASPTVTYNAYTVTAGKAGVDTRDDAAITGVQMAVADLSTARLMANHKALLTITNKVTGKTVARLPLTDYALMLKEGNAAKMDDQEFLDRNDEYAMTLFLDKSGSWASTAIMIGSWRLVVNNTKVEG